MVEACRIVSSVIAANTQVAKDKEHIRSGESINIYSSLSKEGPWAVYLTLGSKREGCAGSNIVQYYVILSAVNSAYNA